MKKVLSLVLVMAMVLSSMSFAFASTSFEDVADTDYEDAINTLVALGIVTGYEDGTYRPEKTVTRAEMAKLLVEISGYGDLVAGSKSNFSDTQGHWADPWIALAAGKNIVIGTGDGKFTPDRTVSYDEAITMIVRALGYTDNCNEIKNMSWPTNFKVKAAELDITDDVAINSTGADRGGVAQLLYNALDADLVTVDSDGDVVKSGKELLTRLATKDEDYTVTSDKVDVDSDNYASEIIDLAPYMYQNLEVFLNDDDQVVYIKDSNSLVVEGSIDDVTLSSDKETITVSVEEADGGIVDVDFDATFDDKDVSNELKTEIKDSIFENGATKKDKVDFSYINDKVENIKIVANETKDTKNNGKIEENEVAGFVFETQTRVARIENEYIEGKDKIDVFALPTDNKDEVDLSKITVTGAVDSLEDINVDDVVVEYLADDDSVTKLVVTRETVEGGVTRVSGSSDVYVDGTKYKVSSTKGAYDSIVLGDEGIFYLDHNGKIADFDGEGEGATDYAVVLSIAAGELDSKFDDDSIDEYPQMKVVTQEGDEVIYDVYVKVNSDGEISGTAKYDGKDLFAEDDRYTKAEDGTYTKSAAGTYVYSDAFAGLDDSVPDDGVSYPQPVKIRLNSDNKITRIDPVADKHVDLDTTKSSFKLANNVMIYDITEKETVSESKLNSTVIGRAVYNKNGEIEVLLTNSVDDATYTFAYLSKIDEARPDGDDVWAVEAYINGEKISTIYTDDDDVFSVSDKKDNVYALDMNGDIIEEAKQVNKTGDVSKLIVAKGVTASAIRSGSSTIELATGWETLADNATIVLYDDGDEELGDLYDIDAKESVLDVYIYDGEVVLIVVYED